MKKLIITAALLFTGVSASFAADPSFFKLSLCDTAAYPLVHSVSGIEIGLLYSNTPSNTGLQGTFIYGKTGNLNGLQLGLVTSADTATGMQWGGVNMAKDMKGAQIGWVNYAEKFTGFQLGFVNYAENMSKGLQIGLVNIIKNSTLPVMVIVNARF
ncbi:MAG: hypothetical protein NTX59_04800 [Elusimicrobia bacterium]|nr:hypothetical protein [Elusimicrobiota bacterium]